MPPTIKRKALRSGTLTVAAETMLAECNMPGNSSISYSLTNSSNDMDISSDNAFGRSSAVLKYQKLETQEPKIERRVICQQLSLKEKGTLYEICVNLHINTLPETMISYLWKDVPEQVLFNVNLITDYNRHRLQRKTKEDITNMLQDIGIDIIQIRQSGEIAFIQCKNYSGTITIDDLAGFWFMMSQHTDIQGMVYHSSDKISRNITQNLVGDRLTFVHYPICDDYRTTTDSAVTLYDYQESVVTLYLQFYQKNDKAILSMPCGTGKTIVSCYISKFHAIVIFISPLKQFAEQNIDRYKQYDKERKCLLVDSDGTRDLSEISAFISKHTKILLSVTYKSCDVIVQLMDTLKLIDVFIIIDEFHNLSAKNIYGAKSVFSECEANFEELEEEDIVQMESEHTDSTCVDSNDEEESYSSNGNDDIYTGDVLGYSSNIDIEEEIGELRENDTVEDPIYQLIHSHHQVLFMSATPRIYEVENDEDCDTNDILGRMVYKMDFKTAIANNY